MLDCNTVNGVPTDIRCTANLPLRDAGVGAATGPDPNVEAALAARQAASVSANPAEATSAQGSPVPTAPPTLTAPQVPLPSGDALQGAAGILVAPSVTPALASAPLTAAQVPLPSTAALIGAATDLVAPSAVPASAPAPLTAAQVPLPSTAALVGAALDLVAPATVPAAAPAPLTVSQIPLPSSEALVGAALDLVAPSSGPAVPPPALPPVGPGKLVTIPSAAGAPGPLIRVGAGTPLDPAAVAQGILQASNNAQP